MAVAVKMMTPLTTCHQVSHFGLVAHDDCQWRGSGGEKISGLRQLRVNREKGGKKIKQGM
jgi:hypothetical protein